MTPELASGVVVAETVAVLAVVSVPVPIELGRVLDLVLGPIDVDLTIIGVDALDDARWEHHLATEDPRAGVDDEEAAARLVGGLIHLADASIGRLDLVTGQIDVLDVDRRSGPEGPDLPWLSVPCSSILP